LTINLSLTGAPWQTSGRKAETKRQNAAAQEISRNGAQEGLAMFDIFKTRSLAVLSLLTICAAFSIGAANADDVTEDQILRALTPAKTPLTRGLSTGPQTQTEPAATAAEGQLIQTLRNRPTRSLSAAEREEIAAVVKDKPKIDLEINFDYNSANISSRSLASVQALGRALSNPELKGSTFIVAGHTDAVGSDGYNQDLSERRADSIKRYLVGKFAIPGSDLVTVGYGKTKLKDPANPTSEVNRRVQVVNMENKATASK
jgi:outer membrane protein OmpA-like peptidoglycan-associated protein